MALVTTILLSVHLLAMNVASAGPLLCVWLRGRGRRGDEVAFSAGRRLAYLAVGAIMVGVATGGALLLAAWIDADQGYWEALTRFPSRELAYAAGEVVFSLVCLVVYAGMWNRWPTRLGDWLHGLWAVLAATNLLYHFPPLMAVLGTLAVRPEFALEPVITRGVFRPLMVRPEILSQSVHFAIASLAVSAIVLMEVAGRLRRQAIELAAAQSAAGAARAGQLIRVGAATALATSLAQLFVGAWVLMVLPLSARNSLVGSDWLATGLFFLAVVATFALLHLLAIVALGDTHDRSVRRCGTLMVAVVVLMTGLLEITRS
jgi:hypothetical protein